MSEAIKNRGACTAVGVTFDPEEAAIARGRLDRVEVADLNDLDPQPLGQFDCILCSHVLEHLYAPEKLLVKLRPSLTPAGVLIVALPKILFWKQRLQFLWGRFRYTDGGLMDRTHYRFYDWRTAQSLIQDAGYQIVQRQADGSFPLSRFLPGVVRRWLDGLALGLAPGVFGWQFVFQCTADTGADGKGDADGQRAGHP